MAVSDGCDDVLWAECRVSAEEDLSVRRLKCRLIDDWHFPFVELHSDIAFDPRERILLADRNENVVRGIENFGLACRDEGAFAGFVVDRTDFFEHDAFYTIGRTGPMR